MERLIDFLNKNRDNRGTFNVRKVFDVRNNIYVQGENNILYSLPLDVKDTNSLGKYFAFLKGKGYEVLCDNLEITNVDPNVMNLLETECIMGSGSDTDLLSMDPETAKALKKTCQEEDRFFGELAKKAEERLII